MKKYIFYFVFFILCVFQVSCFDVVEKITLQNNGSGEFSFILNASKSKTRLTSIMKMKTINGRPVPSQADIKAKVEEVKKVVVQQKGISNVSTSVDLTNYIIKISGKFTHVDQLDNVITSLKNKKIIDVTFPTNIYSYNSTSRTFSKNKINSFKKEYNQLSSADKEVFQNAQYISILQYGTTVKSHSNSTYKLSSNKKALKATFTLLDLINQKSKPEVSIQLN